MWGSARSLLAVLALVGLCSLAQAQVSGGPAQYENPTIAKDGQRYESWLLGNWQASRRPAAELRSEGSRLLTAGDPRAASRSFAAAIANEPANGQGWLGLARSLLAIPDGQMQGNERYTTPTNASGAAYLAYRRSTSDGDRAVALVVLSEALKRRSYWRPAIDALAQSLKLIDDPQVRAAYETLKAEKGFRVVDYTVENEAALPRLCIRFSETLAQDRGRSRADIAKFVLVNGKDPQTVRAEGAQLCVEGLKHGERYEVALRSGLPSAAGELLPKASELTVYVRDRSPAVRFTGRNYVLPSRGQQGIPVVTINTEQVAVTIYRIGDRGLVNAVVSGDLQRQLGAYEAEQIAQEKGQRVYKGTLDVTKRLNDETTSAIPVSDAVGKLEPGVYVMTAAPVRARGEDEGGEVATQWFIVSDLGLTAFTGDDGTHVFVRSLATALPVKGGELRLVARNNEVLGRVMSDERGYARFAPGLQRGEGGLAPAMLVATSADGDYAFLDLSAQAFDLSDRGVKGRAAPGPIDGYLFAERGVYRPGEDVHLTALMRDAAGIASTVPATLIVLRPDGVEHRRIALIDQGLGGRTHKLALADTAMTGTWRGRLHTDPKADPIASVAFLVEDFVPERLELKLDAKDAVLRPDALAGVDVAGRYLYGPPAAGLVLEGDVVVRAARRGDARFPGYLFGDVERTLAPARANLAAGIKTDEQGRARINVELPQLTATARPLEADVQVRMIEPGGRAIERTVSMPVDLQQPRIGIKRLFEGDRLGEGETARFEVIRLDASSKPVPVKGLRWELSRLETSWQWFKRDGAWAYDAVTLARRIAGGALDTANAAPAAIEAKVDWGRFRLDVTTSEPGGPATSVLFDAGWYQSENVDSPEMLEVALDKPAYKPGDTARVRIATRVAGKALVSVLSGGMHLVREADIPAGGGEVAIPVGSDWGAGAYVTAMLYRSLDEKAKRMPGRAVGVAWLGIDTAERTLLVDLATVDKIKSASRLSVPVKITGLQPGEAARVTVAAVDLGILNLTRYKAPAPEGWFYAQRQLGAEIRDLYGRLIDGMRAERGRLRSGGDGSDGMAMQGAPPVEATIAHFSGIVTVRDDGTAEVVFDLEPFNGTVRVMAVAWSRDKVGHGARDVIVRDPVAITASGPRFMTLGDEARLALDLHNVEGPDAAYKVVVEEAGADKGRTALAQDVALAPGARGRAELQLKPAALGLITYDVRVTGPGGIDVRRQLTYDVKPPAGDVKRTTVARLAARGGKLTLSPDLLTDLIESRTRVSLSVGPAATLDVPGLLTQLDRYPYGCAEQTVSRAMPLVYANELARQVGLKTDGELRERIGKAIARVLEMQDASGAFGVWGPRNADLWLTSYVGEFLTRAREAGHAVDQAAFAQMLDRLANFISYSQELKDGGQERAYALYVLARNGRAPIGELRYDIDTRLDSFETPLAKAQLGAAIAMLGDRERAERAFRDAIDALEGDGLDDARRDYGSKLRDGAALVALVGESGVVRTETPRLADVIAKAFRARSHTSTQEQAWLMLAAKALTDRAASTELTVAGKAHRGSLVRSFQPAALKGGGITVANQGDAPTSAVVTVIGSSLTPEPPIAKGFTIERRYYRLDGQEVVLASAGGGAAELKQSDRLVVVLTVEAEDTGGRILLVDRLPAGLEIENPRLVDGGNVKALAWLKPTVAPEQTEFRDDRFVAAFDFFAGNDGKEDQSNATVAYVVRAVTPGSFVHPAATVEDMYRPERHARTAAGRLTVKVAE